MAGRLIKVVGCGLAIRPFSPSGGHAGSGLASPLLRRRGPRLVRGPALRREDAALLPPAVQLCRSDCLGIRRLSTPFCWGSCDPRLETRGSQLPEWRAEAWADAPWIRRLEKTSHSGMTFPRNQTEYW